MKLFLLTCLYFIKRSIVLCLHMKLWNQHFYVVKLIKISTRMKENKTKRWGVTECLCLCNVSFDSFYKWQCYSNRNDKNTDVCVINPTVSGGTQKLCSTGLNSLTAGNNSMVTLCLAINITLIPIYNHKCSCWQSITLIILNAAELQMGIWVLN